MVCFELFVRTAINALAGVEPSVPVPIKARMQVAFQHRDDRPVYYPSRLEWTPDGPRVTPVNWKGSSDIRSTVDADAMVLFPPGERRYEVDDAVDAFAW
jgi:molybdopterin molybdotransferase